MKLEQAIPYLRTGYYIYRKSRPEAFVNNSDLGQISDYRIGQLGYLDFLSDDWEVFLTKGDLKNGCH